MPPQQAYGLLDFIDDGFHFGAHRIPRLIMRETLLRQKAKAGKRTDINGHTAICKPVPGNLSKDRLFHGGRPALPRAKRFLEYPFHLETQ